MDPIAEFLAQRPLMILDGALATELERRGADLHDPLWSAKLLLERPRLISAVHADYFDAGADVATTATYQASFEGFALRGVEAAAAAQLMRAAVALAIEARDAFWSGPAASPDRLRPLVAASIGPFGAMLADGSEYRGAYAASDAALVEFHRPRMQVLAHAGADLLACETIPSLREALLLAQLVQESNETCAWISFSCRDGEYTCEGQRIEACVRALNEYPRIVSVGVNCTRPEFVGSLLRRMRAHTDKPLLVYPNSGEVYDPVSKCWLGRGDSMPFADRAQRWRDDGAQLIGGCCRTTPEDIRTLRRGLLSCA